MAKRAINEKVRDYIKIVKEYLTEKGDWNDVDEGQIETLEDSYRTFLYAKEELRDNGHFILNRFGDKIASPAIKVTQDAKIRMEKCLELLGITIKARTKGKKEKVEDSPLVSFLKSEMN